MWNTFQTNLLAAFGATAGQLLTLVAPLLLFGWTLHLAAGLLERSSVRLLGLRAYLYTIGWPGTLVHELGHAMFCPVFGHRITGMRLFSISTRNRQAGYLSHSYSSGNLWHLAGNFFISVGPLVLGSAVIYLLLRYMAGLPLSIRGMVGGTMALDTASGLVSWLSRFAVQLWHTSLEILRHIRWSDWRTWLAGWLVLSVGSGMTLSPQDLKAAASGLGVILLVLVIANLSAMLLGYSSPDYSGMIRLSVTACLLMILVLTVCCTATLIIRALAGLLGR
jgi:hypothetical protein